MRFTRSRRGSGHAEVQVCVRITCVDKDGERTQSIRELKRGHVSVSRISLHSGEELLPWSDACICEKTPNKGTARSSTTVSHLHFPTNSEITREPGETAAAYSCIWQHVSFSKQRKREIPALVKQPLVNVEDRCWDKFCFKSIQHNTNKCVMNAWVSAWCL